MQVRGEPVKDLYWSCFCGHIFCDKAFPTTCETAKTKANILKALRASNWGRGFAKWLCPDCYQKYLAGTLPKGRR
jgi:hypothetical protein